MINHSTHEQIIISKSVEIALATALPLSQVVAQEKSLTVFAAASLKNALDDINAAFTKATNTKVVVSYGASSALAKQIEGGAPADAFVSADLQWMDYVGQKNLIKPDTRVNLLGNKLVLIAPADSKIDKVEIAKGFDVAKLTGNGRLAVADVRAVPAGLYAKAALESLGSWAAVEPKLAMAENVRATLAFVARGETPLGIIYETDAKVEPKVKMSVSSRKARTRRLSIPWRLRPRAQMRRLPVISTFCAHQPPRRSSSATASAI